MLDATLQKLKHSWCDEYYDAMEAVTRRLSHHDYLTWIWTGTLTCPSILIFPLIPTSYHAILTCCPLISTSCPLIWTWTFPETWIYHEIWTYPATQIYHEILTWTCPLRLIGIYSYLVTLTCPCVLSPTSLSCHSLIVLFFCLLISICF